MFSRRTIRWWISSPDAANENERTFSVFFGLWPIRRINEAIEFRRDVLAVSSM
jgi:hypothetical protein